MGRVMYGDFAKAMGWSNPPTFPPCIPTLGHGRDAREVIREAREEVRDRRGDRGAG